MTSRANTVRDLFDELVELDALERARRLATVEDAVRAELEALLVADGTEPALLSPEWMAELLVPAASGVGERVGAYELTDVIGRGGMGDVFAAERVEGDFDQRVAVKLVRRDLATPRALERFGRERQILANLRHPNIAQLFDGGVTPEGRPYLVMELIDGSPIDQHCQASGLAIGERLRLFVDACAAVEHAHTNLVVHCDLKPENVLVTSDGEVKLLDFGIATALSADADGAAPRAMTPEYAAPELFDGAAATTATDVYSLGVVLYELLTGMRPIALSQLDRDEQRHRVHETTPLAPSVRAAEGDGDRVSSDLDAICSRALERDPARRYQSARALAADLVATLEHRPVAARPRRLTYIASRFARRHALGLATVLTAVAIIAVLVVVSTVRNAAERDRAQTEARRAQAAARALASVFTAADPAVAQGQVTVAELLRSGRARIEAELAGDPRTLAELHAVLARVHFNLGHYGDAEMLFSAALATERSIEPTSERVADLLTRLAAAMREQSKLADAEATVRSALALRRLRGQSLPVASTLLELSALLVDRARFADALKRANEALAIQESLGASTEALSDTHHAIGTALSQSGDFRAAEASYRRAHETSLAARGARHPKTATALADVAYALRKQARYDDAEPLYREALAIRESIFEGDHADVAHNLNHLGRLLFQKGDAAGAVPSLRRALAMRRRLYGTSHAAVSASLGTLSKTLIALGQLDEAEALARESQGIIEKLYGDSHLYSAGAIVGVGRVVALRGDRQEAIKLFRRALTLARDVLPPGNSRLAGMLTNLAAALCDGTGDERVEGRQLLSEAAALLADVLDASHPQRVAASQALAACGS